MFRERRRQRPSAALGIGIGAILFVAATAVAAQPVADCALRRAPLLDPLAARGRSPADASLAQGNAAWLGGEAEAALAAYRAAEEAYRAAGQPERALAARVNALHAVHALEGAAVLRRALDRIEAAEDPPGEATASPALRLRRSLQLARHRARLADDATATDEERARDARLASARLAGLASEADEANEPELASHALGHRALLYAEAGRLDEAHTLVRRALRAASRAGSRRAELEWRRALVGIETRRGNPAAALASARRAVLLAEEIDWLWVPEQDPWRVRPGSGARPDPPSVQAYRTAVDLILRAAARQPAGEDQALLAEARSTLERLKTEELTTYFDDPCLASQRRVSLDRLPGAVVLYPIFLADRVELVLHHEGRFSRFTVEMDPAALTETIRALRFQLPNRMTREYRLPAATLFDQIVRPWQAILEKADTLVVVPSGPLVEIPFAALYDTAASRHLIEQVAISVVPGLDLTEPRPLAQEGIRALVAGLSESVQGFVALEGVTEEIALVEATYPSIVLADAAFRAEAVRRAVRVNPVNIVHIASHGQFNEEASDSFLLTIDGRISMAELAESISATQLRADEPLELIVLSACESAAGDERAALGLAGVAVQSGARSALATIWSVNDEATVRVIRRFYAGLRAGESRSQALRAAQLEVLRAPDFGHPANWAPYLLIGSWL